MYVAFWGDITIQGIFDTETPLPVETVEITGGVVECPSWFQRSMNRRQTFHWVGTML
jgi:hypothetical protein